MLMIEKEVDSYISKFLNKIDSRDKYLFVAPTFRKAKEIFEKFVKRIEFNNVFYNTKTERHRITRESDRCIIHGNSADIIFTCIGDVCNLRGYRPKEINIIDSHFISDTQRKELLSIYETVVNWR